MVVGIFKTNFLVEASVLLFALNVGRLVGNVSRLGGSNTAFVSDANFINSKAGPPFLNGSLPFEDWFLILVQSLSGPPVTTRFLTWICLLGERGGLQVPTANGLNQMRTVWQTP